MMGQLAQLGIGIGANSVLLKFSRGAESQADLLGSHLMAESGYDPVQMARFFDKLSAQGGQRAPEFGQVVSVVEGFCPRVEVLLPGACAIGVPSRAASAIAIPSSCERRA